ncbi:MAG: hypothetical protein GX299_02940 [Epulopiscium sp.]|jgi:repressor LexA|nr:hypothetical protein [Candidatus Epulonipiscium sp.]
MFQKVLFKTQLEKLMNHCTTTEFSEKTGFNRTYLSKYLNLKLDRPPSPHLLKSIAGSAASYEELMFSCGYLSSTSNVKQHLIKIPVLTPALLKNSPSSVTDMEEYEYMDMRHLSPDHSYFYFKVEGDAMINARIYHGDLAFVRRQTDVASGDIAVVSIAQRDVVLTRIIKKENIVVLQWENPSHPPHILSEEEQNQLQVIGKVLHVKFVVSQ